MDWSADKLDQVLGPIFATLFVVALGLGLLWLVIRFIKNIPQALLGYQKIVLNEFENAVVHKNGQFERVLLPGTHKIKSGNRRIIIVDTRPEVLRLDQTCITSDRFSVALSCLARVQVSDPKAAVAVSQNHKDEIYARLQLAVKKLCARLTVKEFQAEHENISLEAQKFATEAIADAGYKCIGFELLQAEPLGTTTEFDARQVGFTPR